MVRLYFSLGSYHDHADCDVVPMQACSLLLGRPWEYDNDALHHGRSNQYTFMHKGKKIVLHSMSLTANLKYDLERAQREKRNGKTVIQDKANEIAQPKNKESNSKKGEI